MDRMELYNLYTQKSDHKTKFPTPGDFSSYSTLPQDDKK